MLTAIGDMLSRVQPASRIDEDLGTLLARYAALVRRTVCKIAAGRAAAPEEIEQRVLESLWKAAREQTILHPASYVYRIAVRETVRALRRERRDPVSDNEAAAHEEPAGAPDPERAAAGREVARAVDRALARLHAERAAAVRAHVAGFSVEEIMQANGWTYQKARNLIARGVADLREALRAEGIDGA